MKLISTKAALLAVLALGIGGSLAAHAASDTAPVAKQQTGEGDTGHGDRAPSFVTKQQTGEGDTGYGDRAPSFVTKQ